MIYYFALKLNVVKLHSDPRPYKIKF